MFVHGRMSFHPLSYPRARSLSLYDNTFVRTHDLVGTKQPKLRHLQICFHFTIVYNCLNERRLPLWPSITVIPQQRGRQGRGAGEEGLSDNLPKNPEHGSMYSTRGPGYSEGANL